MQTEETITGTQTTVLPASYGQQRLWFLNRLESDGGAYNVPLVKRLRGPLDVPALEHALGALVARHETLRTVFEVIDGFPHQIIEPPTPSALPVIDLRGQPDAEQRALALVTEHGREGFQLETDRSIRWMLVTLADDDHLLSLTLHHIVADGWSMRVLNRDLAELYGAFRDDRQPQLSELEIQYGDFAVWEREWIESGGLDSQMQYWLRELKGAPPLLELPTDRPRPVQQSFRGDAVRTVLSADLLAELKQLAESEGQTLFMTLLAAYVSLLHRYTRQDDLIVAYPVANRNRVELEALIGLFVNTLALRVSASGDPTFRQLLARVQEKAVGALANQELPFEKLVEELNPERNLSYAPVAQVMFLYQTEFGEPIEMPGLQQERVLTERHTSKVDLTLSVGDTPDGLRVSLEYCAELFDRTTIERMLEHFERLLTAAVANPDERISRLSLLPDAEREILIRGFNDTARPYPDACLHELISRQAARTPGRVAVECAGIELTYQELEQRSGALARRLRELGVTPGVLVGVCLERSVQMIVGLLGVLKAGGTYVPIDPGFPAERQRLMLESSQARLLLTEEALIEGLPETDAAILRLDSEWPAIADLPALPADGPADPARLAYVIYTSGSTGVPKGVEISHRALVNLLCAMRDRPGLDDADVLVAVTTLSFDIAGLELYLPLITGARLVLARADEASDPRALARVLDRSQATVMQATPTTWRMLLDEGWTGRPGLRALCGGEPLPQALSDRLVALDLELWNMYGPTETTIWSTCTRIETRGTPLSIGRPIANTQLYVLDAELAPVPIGVPGELCIGGDGLAEGYRGRPDLTADRFVTTALDAPAGQRLYRTGDLVRYRADGNVQFLGRIDSQVKLRGYRIELGEIEAGLGSHPAVRDAVAAVLGDGPDAQLVAYVIPEVAPVAATELRQHLQSRLPDYMLPSAFVTLERFPLTPNGKVNRRALPAPDGDSRARTAFVAADTELERSLASIWSRLLNISEVGVADDFFALGGHSLLAVQLVHAIEDELGRTCTLAMLFRNRTIGELATELQRGGVDATEATVLELAHGSGPPLFCICGVHAYQELAEELAPEHSVYGVFLPVEQETQSGPGVFRRRPTVEVMAAAYVSAIREHQPDGPYSLLGFCFGGILAYEAAQQLRRDGEEVNLVVMLDSMLRSVMQTGRVRLTPRIKRAVRRQCDRLPIPVQRTLMGEAWVDPVQRLERIRGRVYTGAMRRYKVDRYPGRTLLVQPQRSNSAYATERTDQTWGWGRFISELEVRDVPGGHVSVLSRPHVAILARAVRPHLTPSGADVDQNPVG